MSPRRNTNHLITVTNYVNVMDYSLPNSWKVKVISSLFELDTGIPLFPSETKTPKRKSLCPASTHYIWESSNSIFKHNHNDINIRMKKLTGSPSTPLLSLKVILNLIHKNQLPSISQNPWNSSGWCWSGLSNPSICWTEEGKKWSRSCHFAFSYWVMQ